MKRLRRTTACLIALPLLLLGPLCHAESLPKIRVAPDQHHFQTERGEPFTPFGVTYYRPGTGWAPQLWKQFDPEATRADFARMKKLGVTCVRVFLSYGSFYSEPNRLDPAGLAKFDQFLDMAEAAQVYVHPTGPDHWEGTPGWAKGDHFADDTYLEALENFWHQFAARYRARHVIFAYDLLNEPAVSWDTPAMRPKWQRWVETKYGSVPAALQQWGMASATSEGAQAPVPAAKDNLRSRQLLDYQQFRESLADAWTERQVRAIKGVDPEALVTIGLVQWSIPVGLSRVSQYAAFRPERQAPCLDFMEIHFYPLNHGFYEYKGRPDEAGNLAYLESVVREAAKPGKPVVVAEFGWYGGGRLTIDGGKHPPATEKQQARWCEAVIRTTAGLATGWLNWGLYDTPQAGDVSQLTGLLTVDGRVKRWGEQFRRMDSGRAMSSRRPPDLRHRPTLDWEACVTSIAAGEKFRNDYTRDIHNR